MENLDRLVLEIVTKEFEKNELRYIGLSCEAPSALASRIMERQLPRTTAKGRDNITTDEYCELKSAVVAELYRILEYEEFVQEQRKLGEQTPFANTLKLGLRRALANKSKTAPQTTLDRELKTDRTISYYLSTLLFRDLYNGFRFDREDFATPSELRRCFWDNASQIFPLDFPVFVEQLRRNDEDFWESVCKVLEKIAGDVTNSRMWSSNGRDIARDEVVSESYIELKKKVRIQQFNDASHFRRYAYNVCLFKLREHWRSLKKESKVDLPGDDFWKREPFGQDDPQTANWEAHWSSWEGAPKATQSASETADGRARMEVDTANRYELARAAAVILLDASHPMRSLLIGENDSKVRLLIDVAVNNMSYDEIIDDRYDPDEKLSERERKKLNDKLRQEYSRIKKNIVDRLKTILDENGKTCTYRV